MKSDRRSKLLGPLLVIGGGLLLMAAVVVLAQRDVPSVPSAAAPRPEEGTDAEVARVPLKEAKAAFDSGEALFVDVRAEATYQTGHIPGAINIPLAQTEARLGEVDPGRWIITYCT